MTDKMNKFRPLGDEYSRPQNLRCNTSVVMYVCYVSFDILEILEHLSNVGPDIELPIYKLYPHLFLAKKGVHQTSSMISIIIGELAS